MDGHEFEYFCGDLLKKNEFSNVEVTRGSGDQGIDIIANILQVYQEQYDTTLSDMVGSEDYPNFTDIKANSDFTNFTVTTTSTELDLTDSISIMGFYMYGGMYAIFNGTKADNIHVDFVNAESGEIISSSDSSDIGSTEQS